MQWPSIWELHRGCWDSCLCGTLLCCYQKDIWFVSSLTVHFLHLLIIRVRVPCNHHVIYLRTLPLLRFSLNIWNPDVLSVWNKTLFTSTYLTHESQDLSYHVVRLKTVQPFCLHLLLYHVSFAHPIHTSFLVLPTLFIHRLTMSVWKQRPASQLWGHMLREVWHFGHWAFHL